MWPFPVYILKFVKFGALPIIYRTFYKDRYIINIKNK